MNKPTRLLLLFLIILSPFAAHAQTRPDQAGPYPWLRLDTTFSIPSIITGNIPCAVFYPQGPFSSTEKFPVVVFGHGFVMNYDVYNKILQHIATWGYIVLTPNVQSGLSPSHGDFAKQMAACITFVQNEGQRVGSRFYGRVDTSSAVMGHSMGGGVSQIVQAQFPRLTAIAGLSPNNTNTTPDAITSMSSNTLPFLVLGAKGDRVSPESTQQILMYNNSQGPKQRVSLNIGGHCSYTDAPNTTCNLGATTSGEPTTNGQQATLDVVQNISKRYLTAFFNTVLRGSNQYRRYLCGDSALADTRIDFEQVGLCSFTGIAPDLSTTKPELLLGLQEHSYVLRHAKPLGVLDLSGRQIPLQFAREGADSWSFQLPALPTGLYMLQTTRGPLKLLLTH
jgi:dienelactone hydrolase